VTRPVLRLATGNLHKVEEIASILPGWTIEPWPPEVEEIGDTFEANALLKAHAVAAASGEPAVADDSGIEIDALGGAPGIHSARWTEEADWIPRVLRELKDRPRPERGARFVCAAAVAWPDGREAVVRGTVEGHIAPDARGERGFGYDPIFIPVEGDGRTFGEMSAPEKHHLSHRARAFRALEPRLSL
jgi:XTP/dITP diphosphohydrolase